MADCQTTLKIVLVQVVFNFFLCIVHSIEISSRCVDESSLRALPEWCYIDFLCPVCSIDYIGSLACFALRRTLSAIRQISGISLHFICLTPLTKTIALTLIFYIFNCHEENCKVAIRAVSSLKRNMQLKQNQYISN